MRPDRGKGTGSEARTGLACSLATTEANVAREEWSEREESSKWSQRGKGVEELSQIALDLGVHCRDFGFYPEWDEEPLEGFEQGAKWWA